MRHLTRHPLLALILGTAFSESTLSAPASGSPYFLDHQSEYVQDATSDRISTVNMIMCFMTALRPDAMVNRGDYVALVDKNQCDSKRKADAGNSGSSSGGSQADYMRAVVNSTRASNTSPMQVKIWFENQEDGQPMDIYIRAQVDAAPASGNPFGVFSLNYCGRDAGGVVPGCLFRGRLSANSTGLAFYEDEGGGRTTQLLLNNTGNAESGSGAIRSVQPPGPDVANLFGFNSTHFLRGDGASNVCFSRDRDTAESSVWRYGVYTTSGARFERNSGFAVKFVGAGGTVYQGYMGYYGLFLPDESGVLNGDTLVKQGSGGGPDTDYTLVKLGGRLTRFTRRVSNLAAIGKVRFTVSAWQFPAPPFANYTTIAGKTFIQSQAANDRVELYWDDEAGTFKATGLQTCGATGCVSSRFVPAQSVDPAVLASGTMARGFQGHSPALGGEVFVNLGSAAPASTTPVVTREQALVYPGEYPASLLCVNNCVRASQLAPGNLQTGNIFFPGNGQAWSANQVRTYTFSGDLLQDEESNSVITGIPANQLQGTPFQWGIRTGFLADTSTLSGGAADLDCSAPSPAGQYCADRINALDTYYVWETGPNHWNGFTALRDGSNAFLRFDAPINLNYTVPAGAAYGDYAGSSVVLQYNGFGNLWGLPGKCVSPHDNVEVNCSNGNARFVPQFSIPHDLAAGAVTSGPSTYYVKWLDRELRLAQVPLANCATLGLPALASFTLPGSADVQDPSDGTQPAVYIGAKPALTSAPAVIHGVVQ